MKYKLKLTSAIAFEGSLRRKGAEIEADEQLARDLLRRGKAELIDAPVADEPDEPEVDLSKMSKAQVVAVANGLGIEGAGNMSKTALIDAIKKYEES